MQKSIWTLVQIIEFKYLAENWAEARNFQGTSFPLAKAEGQLIGGSNAGRSFYPELSFFLIPISYS
jgi:hypothetical protein